MKYTVPKAGLYQIYTPLASLIVRLETHMTYDISIDSSSKTIKVTPTEFENITIEPIAVEQHTTLTNTTTYRYGAYYREGEYLKVTIDIQRVSSSELMKFLPSGFNYDLSNYSIYTMGSLTYVNIKVIGWTNNTIVR